MPLVTYRSFALFRLTAVEGGLASADTTEGSRIRAATKRNRVYLHTRRGSISNTTVHLVHTLALFIILPPRFIAGS